jgi:hypothetical protein
MSRPRVAQQNQTLRPATEARTSIVFFGSQLFQPPIEVFRASLENQHRISQTSIRSSRHLVSQGLRHVRDRQILLTS